MNYLSAEKSILSARIQKKPSPPMAGRVPLPDEDSNLDKQNQNLSYCLYTIGQSPEQAAKLRFFKKCSELKTETATTFSIISPPRGKNSFSLSEPVYIFHAGEVLCPH